MSDRQELLRRAALCYQGAGLLHDACRCLEGAGDFTAAGRLHEELQRTEQAAHCYQRGGAWIDAARCWLRCADPIQAAECLLQGNESIEAAWVFAENAHRYDRARALASGVEPDSPASALRRDLVLARCEAGNGDRLRGGALLASGIEPLTSLGPGFDAEDLLDRALALSQRLHRPDLATTLFAAAHACGHFRDLEQRWERWSADTLGTTEFIPVDTG